MGLSELEIGFVVGSAKWDFNRQYGSHEKVNKLIIQKCLFIALLYQLLVWPLYR